MTGSGRPFINTKTPTLKTVVTQGDGSTSTVNFEWWAVGGASRIGTAAVTGVASGGTASTVVAAGAFTEGNNFMWKVDAVSGTATSAWSGYCEFTVDTTAPSTPPTASSTQYPAGQWSGSAGTAGTFTLGAGGVADVNSYLYGLDTNPPTSSVAATTLGGTKDVTITPATNGAHTVYVQSVDRAGNKSAVTAYAFNVGNAVVSSPVLGAITGSTTMLAGSSQSGTGVTFQWRRSDTDTWANIPIGDVTYTQGGGAVSAWPVTMTGSNTPQLNWSVKSTLGGAAALAGPLQVQAVFTGGSGNTSPPVEFTFDQNLATAPAPQVGPGSVNLMTGNYAIDALDGFDGSTLDITRDYATRQASVIDPMFGPGWVSSVAGTDGLSKTNSLVQIGQTDGSTIGYSQTSIDSSGSTYTPQIGVRRSSLVYVSGTDKYTLTDADGNTTMFNLIGGTTYEPTSLTPAGSTATTTLTWQTSANGARPTQILAPVPSGVSCTTLVKGCRAMTFSYATATTATGTSQAGWGDYTGRLNSVSVTAWDPATAGMKTVVVSQYAYDSNGRLAAQWDPRLDNGATHLWTTYSYDANGILSTMTPPAQQPWTFSYTTIPGDTGRGRLAAVSRSALSAGTATSTVVYNVPACPTQGQCTVSGSAAPYDLGAAQTSRWGQTAAPVAATAVFGSDFVPNGNQTTGVMPSSFVGADVTYMDANSRTVDHADGNGNIDSSWYDSYGNITQSLTAGDRAEALNASSTDTVSTEAALAGNYSTYNTYNSDGSELTFTKGPYHVVQLANGSTTPARSTFTYTYDEGAPPGTCPCGLVTTETDAIMYWDGGSPGVGTLQLNQEPHKTTSTYDWTTEQQLTSVVDPAGLNLVTAFTYDTTTGAQTSVTQPGGVGTTNTPQTMKTIYYRAGTGSGYADCDSHPEWDGLVCRTQVGGQAATGPEVLVKLYSYDMFNQQASLIEKTDITGSGGTVQRTATTTYDSAERPSTTSITTAAGLGTAVPITKVIYDPATGMSTQTQSLDAGNNVTAHIDRSYDSLGRMTSYTDADGNITTTTYDKNSRVATTNDGKGTRTYTYNGGNEHRGLATQVVDSQGGTFTASYDGDGNSVAQNWPNNIAVAMTFNETGDATAISYTQSGAPLYTQTVTESAAGQTMSSSSTLSKQNYVYDNAGRMSVVNDTLTACTTRTFGFNSATDRINMTSYDPNTDGTCQTSTAASTSNWNYDTADRITNTGYTYDPLGRTTSTPNTDTETPDNGTVTEAYYTNNMVQNLTQGSRSDSYTLDPDANRIRTWTDVTDAGAVTRVNHYAADSDSPTWTDESGGNMSRMIGSVGGVAGIFYNTTGIIWQISNPRGDFVAGVAETGVGLTYTSEYTESGQPRNSSDAGTRRYGWMGQSLRAADAPGGMTLMGLRVANPSTGRFLSVDSVYGGSSNAYDYASGDPVNNADPSGASTVHYWRHVYWYKTSFNWDFNKFYTANVLYDVVKSAGPVVGILAGAAMCLKLTIPWAAGACAAIVAIDYVWIVNSVIHARAYKECFKVSVTLYAGWPVPSVGFGWDNGSSCYSY